MLPFGARRSHRPQGVGSKRVRPPFFRVPGRTHLLRFSFDAGRPLATAEVLSGQHGDVNTPAEPEKAAPRRVAVEAAGPTFVQEFPPYSVNVIRLKAK